MNGRHPPGDLVYADAQFLDRARPPTASEDMLLLLLLVLQLQQLNPTVIGKRAHATNFQAHFCQGLDRSCVRVCMFA